MTKNKEEYEKYRGIYDRNTILLSLGYVGVGFSLPIMFYILFSEFSVKIVCFCIVYSLLLLAVAMPIGGLLKKYDEHIAQLKKKIDDKND